MRSRLVCYGQLLVLMALLVGCSGEHRFPTGKVRGKISYRSKPLPTGTVMFVPEGDKPAATGEIKPDGTYELTTYEAGDGAVLGPHAVMITAVEDMSNKLPEEQSGTPRMLIPLKYGDTSTSQLTAEVAEGENTVDFNLPD